MSYDVYLTVDTGADEPVGIADWNYTSNCGSMWRHAGVDLRALDGVPAPVAAEAINNAVKHMESDPDTYRAMNPPNGWGDYDGALTFLRNIADACATHTKAKLGVSY